MNISELPGFYDIINNKLEDVAKKLFYDREILEAKVDRGFYLHPYVKRAKVVFLEGDELKFYVKHSHENPFNEALGMSLINRLYYNIYRYIVNDTIVVTQEIPGKLFKYISLNERDENAKSFGRAKEIADFFNISDRSNKNIILTPENEFIHIDLAMIFGHLSLGYKTNRKKEEIAGRKEARKILFENYYDKKDEIEEMIKKAKRKGAKFFKNPIRHMKRYVCKYS